MTNNFLESKNSRFHNSHKEFTEKVYGMQGILPGRYVFVLTNLCNLRCDFCFQDRKLKKNSMTGDNWIEVSKQLPEYARVTLTGGEPLIFKEFNKIFKYIAERFDCNIITNGLLLTEEKIDYLLSFPRFKVLSLSIDDIGNKMRGLEPKQWKNLEDKLNYFVKKKGENSDCLLDVKTMILDENAGQLFATYKYLVEKLKIDTHTFQFLKGSKIQHADIMFEFEDITNKSEARMYNNFDVIKTQLEKVRKYNIITEKVSYLHPKVASLISKNSLSNINYINNRSHIKENYFPCKYPWSSIHINSDGNLFPCLSISMGNVKNKSLKEIINGSEFNKFKKTIKEQGTVEACNRCGWLRPKEELL